MKYYVNLANYDVFVKEANFFEAQGGLTKDWGKSWVPVLASSIEDARRKGIEMKKERGERVLDSEYNEPCP